MVNPRLMINVAALALVTLCSAVPALADKGGGPDGYGPPGQLKKTVSAPGPIAGFGLPILAVGGAYIWIRRKQRRAQGTADGA
jgi:hypothetical protein